MSTWLICIYYKSPLFSCPSWYYRAAYHISIRYDYNIQSYGFEMNPAIHVAIANYVNLHFIFNSCHGCNETSDREEPLLSFINNMTDSIGAIPPGITLHALWQINYYIWNIHSVISQNVSDNLATLRDSFVSSLNLETFSRYRHHLLQMTNHTTTTI